MALCTESRTLNLMIKEKGEKWVGFAPERHRTQHRAGGVSGDRGSRGETVTAVLGGAEGPCRACGAVCEQSVSILGLW